MSKFISLYHLGVVGLLGLPATVLAQGTPAAAKPAAAKPAAVPAASKPAATPGVAKPADAAAAPAPAARQAATGPAVRYAVSFLNAYYVIATDGGGKLLPISRNDPYSWDVKPGADGIVQFSYTLYGDRSDGTYAGIDQQHAHLNLPATLCYAQGLEGRAAEVKFELPAGWKAATQLRALGEDRATFAAPNLQYLMDSPVVLGTQQTLHTWQDGGRTFEMATYYSGSASEVEAFVKKTQQVVREAAGIFGGEYPAFDYGRYTFLADYLPEASGDGMEHRNSTSLTSPLPLHDEGALRNLGTVSHEFFHSYNTERL
ncbi:MAG: M61 family peptidase, partial [Hymenobacter sp.]